MSDNFRTGINATASINGTELPFSEWSINPTTELARFANSKTGNKRAKSATYVEATGSWTYDWDDANQPFIAPLSITVGTRLTTVKLQIDGSSGTLFWALSQIIVVSTPQRWMRDGKPVLTINWENDQGTITPPGPGTAF